MEGTENARHYTWETVKHVAIRRGEKHFALSSGARTIGKSTPAIIPPDERIFHAPCIFLPDVSNPRHIGRAPNFPRRWEACERKTFKCASHCCNKRTSGYSLFNRSFYRKKICDKTRFDKATG